MESEESKKKACRLRIEGRVQGVGFRFSALRVAKRYGVRGWIRNEYDGSVTAFCEGEAAAVDMFCEWCRQGPPGAKVMNLDIVPESFPGSFSGFSIAP